MVAASWPCRRASAQPPASEKEGVRQAALDYLEGIYNVQPERIERSVHPTLNKRGFYKKDAASPYVESPMTYEQLVKLAASWNKDGSATTKSGTSRFSTSSTKPRSSS